VGHNFISFMQLMDWSFSQTCWLQLIYSYKLTFWNGWFSSQWMRSGGAGFKQGISLRGETVQAFDRFFWYPPNAGCDLPNETDSVKVSHCSRLIHFLSLDLSCLRTTIMVPAILWWWGEERKELGLSHQSAPLTVVGRVIIY